MQDQMHVHSLCAQVSGPTHGGPTDRRDAPGNLLTSCQLEVTVSELPAARRALPCRKGIQMVTTYNGMLAAELGDVRWQKSWHSNPNGECVELAALPTGEIAMRNSRFPTGPVLLYTQAEITAFLAGAKDGEFDHLLGEPGHLTRQ